MGPDNGPVIAIDGPAASGKSTVALALARRLGLNLVDSGSMYRSVTLLALEKGVHLEDKALSELAREVSRAFRLELTDDAPPRIYLGDREVTHDIRSTEVGEAVSPVSRVAAVREEMVRLQRSMVSGRGAVVEGRDIGTTIFPDAPLKVFLEASASERTRRRYVESVEKELPATESQVAQAISTRDRIDSSREHSPLAVAPDAVALDTSDMTIEQVVDFIVSELDARGLGSRPVV